MKKWLRKLVTRWRKDRWENGSAGKPKRATISNKQDCDSKTKLRLESDE